MRSCLSCDGEFEDRIEICPECGVSTSDDAARARMNAARAAAATERYVQAHTLDGPVDKAMLTAMLTDAGVPWVLHDHAADVLQPLIGLGRGAGVILVPRSRLSETRALIAEFQAAAPI